MTTQSISWTLSNGQTVEITARGCGQYNAAIAGKSVSAASMGITIPQQIPAPAARAGIVAFVGGQIGLTAERKTALETLDQAVTEERTATDEPLRQLLRLEAHLVAAEAALTEFGYGDNGEHGEAVQEARILLNGWKAAYPEFWSQEQARRQTEREVRQAETRQSFAARNLD